MARVGVPDEERARPQRIVVNLALEPRHSFGTLRDDLARSVDYAIVCEELKHFVFGREDRLIETLAHEMARFLLGRFAIVCLELEVRKFVVPETKYVAAKVVRTTGDS